jgi:hypothetical protein
VRDEELDGVSAVALNYASHAHSGSTLEQSAGDNGVGTRDSVATTSDGQDTVMHTLHNFADTGLDASLVPEIGDVLAAFANNDTGFLGGYDRTKGKLGLGVFLFRLRGGLAVRAKAVLHSELVHLIEDVAAVAGDVILRSRHLCW